MKALLADPQQKVTQYARKAGLNTTHFVESLKKHCPAGYAEYVDKHHGDVPSKQCLHCGSEFTPANGKQVFCTRQCGTRHSANLSYFGGKRDTAVGMKEGICQLCRKRHDNDKKQMHAHHVIGKQHDPDNKIMVALCPGCHQLVGMAARNKGLVGSREAWEAFIQLAWLEANGHRADIAAIYTCVEIEPTTYEQEELVSPQQHQDALQRRLSRIPALS
jgi:ferredoxin-like protein FixX